MREPKSKTVYGIVLYLVDRLHHSFKYPWLVKSLNQELWALDQISSAKRIVGMAAEIGTKGDLFVFTLSMKSSIIIR